MIFSFLVSSFVFLFGLKNIWVLFKSQKLHQFITLFTAGPVFDRLRTDLRLLYGFFSSSSITILYPMEMSKRDPGAEEVTNLTNLRSGLATRPLNYTTKGRVNLTSMSQHPSALSLTCYCRGARSTARYCHPPLQT